MSDKTRRLKVEISDVKLHSVPDIASPRDSLDVESFQDLHTERLDNFLRAGMQRKTAVTLANGGLESIDDINRLGETGLLRIPNLGRIKMADIRRALGWPDPTKPLSSAVSP